MECDVVGAEGLLLPVLLHHHRVDASCSLGDRHGRPSAVVHELTKLGELQVVTPDPAIDLTVPSMRAGFLSRLADLDAQPGALTTSRGADPLGPAPFVRCDTRRAVAAVAASTSTGSGGRGFDGSDLGRTSRGRGVEGDCQPPFSPTVNVPSTRSPCGQRQPPRHLRGRAPEGLDSRGRLRARLPASSRPGYSILRTVHAGRRTSGEYGHAWVLDTGLRQFRLERCSAMGSARELSRPPYLERSPEKGIEPLTFSLRVRLLCRLSYSGGTGDSIRRARGSRAGSWAMRDWSMRVSLGKTSSFRATRSRRWMASTISSGWRAVARASR